MTSSVNLSVSFQYSRPSHSRFLTGWQSYMPRRLQIVHRPNYKLKLFANWNRDTASVWSKTNKIAVSSWWERTIVSRPSSLVVPDHTATVKHMELHISTVVRLPSAGRRHLVRIRTFLWASAPHRRSLRECHRIRVHRLGSRDRRGTSAPDCSPSLQSASTEAWNMSRSTTA